MKRFFTIIMALLIVVSLAGCGNHSTNVVKDPEQTSGNHSTSEIKDPAKTETPTKQDDPTTKRYEDPNKDPRMVEQKHWGSGYFAFIDQYNLIGYSLENDAGANGAYYFFDENVDYIPESNSSYKQFYMPPATSDPIEVLGYIDFEKWVDSFNINNATIRSDSKRGVLVVGLPNETTLYISSNECIGYYAYTGGQYRTQWDFYNCSSGGHCLYATFGGENFKITSDMRALWVIEQALSALSNNSIKNPW